MKIIAHRGNVDGPSILENSPSSICYAIKSGFDVECDIRFINGDIYLGHSKPEHKIDVDFLHEISSNAWVHCKNLEALHFLSDFKELNIFWHQEDDFALTTSKHIWTYPYNKLCKKSIMVMPPDSSVITDFDIFGVCTDYPYRIRKISPDVVI